MKKTSVLTFLTALSLVIFFPGCSIFRKAPAVSRTTAQTPAVRHSPVEKAPEKKEAPPPFNVPEFARIVKKPAYTIAFFSPLYLDNIVDTSFSAASLKPIPRFALPGLEFYEGALLALDTLKQEGINLNLYVYDTKSASGAIGNALRSPALNTADLIIGYVTNSVEMNQLSDFAENRKINFVSATWPNDAGIENNPFLIIVNSTLRTHCFAMQTFAQEKFSNKNILIFRRNTPQEEKNSAYIEQAYRKMSFSRKSPIRVVTWDDATTGEAIARHLEAGKNNICIVTALVEDQAKNIMKKLAGLTKNYTINVIGMPTIDGDKDLRGADYKGLNIYYSTPYLNQKAGRMSAYVTSNFRRIYKVRPSDMAFKGFDALYYFTRLLHDNGVYFNKNLNDPFAQSVTGYNFQPFYPAAGQQVPGYFENQHLYFLQLRDGVITPAN